MTTSDIALPPSLGITVYAIVCFLAVWKGDWPERLIGIAKPTGYALTVILRDHTYAGPQWGGLAVDFTILGLLVWAALRSDRQWALWAAGFQLLAVTTHAARALDPTVGAWAYITAGVIFSYMVLVCLGVGVWGCIRRRRMARETAKPNFDH